MKSSWQFGLPEEQSFGFAQAVGVAGLIHVSGQVGSDDSGRPADIEGQMRIAYRRIAWILADAGATMSDVVDETIFVTDIAAASRVAKAVRYDAYGGAPVVASTFIGVAAIGNPRAEVPLLVEIKCTAIAGASR
jgi:enamine deaminase RidA (YjgF/YER057c/UK114 family)